MTNPYTNPVFCPPLYGEDNWMNRKGRPKKKKSKQEPTQAKADAILEKLDLKDAPTIVLPTEEDDLDDEQKKLIARRANCGRHGIRVNPKNGKWKRVKYYCGLWRDGFCPKCYADRMAEIKERYLRARAKCKEPTAAIMSKDEAKKLTRRLRDNDAEYERYPTEQGDIVLFDAAAHEEEGLNIIPLDDLDFDAIVSTPKGRRFSGSLGADDSASTTAEVGDDSISVKVDTVIAKAGEGHKLSEAWTQAVEETKDLNPSFDKDEIEKACRTRIRAYRKAVLAQGGEILLNGTAIEVVSSNSLSWKEDSELDDKHLWVIDLPNGAETPEWIKSSD